MHRYVARRSRIIRNNTDVDGGLIKCEAYDQITINSGATSPIFFQSTNTFVNLLTLIQSSSSFQENIPIFGRYKIVGMNIRASLGAAISTLDAAFTNCAPTLSLAFYPQLINTALGVNPAYNDQKYFLIHLWQYLKQSIGSSTTTILIMEHQALEYGLILHLEYRLDSFHVHLTYQQLQQPQQRCLI